LTKHWIAAVFAAIGIHSAGMVRAEIPAASAPAMLATIADAKSLAKAGRGELLWVGAALSTEQSPSENVLVILDYPVIRELQPGMILILSKLDCRSSEDCLIARRVTEIDSRGEVQTDPYTIQNLLLAKVKATLLGSVAFAIDLSDGSIRDMRPGHAQESITLSQAIEREKTRIVGRAEAKFHMGSS
jgi:hypothetical protein